MWGKASVRVGGGVEAVGVTAINVLLGGENDVATLGIPFEPQLSVAHRAVYGGFTLDTGHWGWKANLTLDDSIGRRR